MAEQLWNHLLLIFRWEVRGFRFGLWVSFRARLEISDRFFSRSISTELKAVVTHFHGLPKIVTGAA